MLEYDFEKSVGYWLLGAWQAYQRAFDEELAPEGVTYRQCQVLGFLAIDGELTQAELAERMRIEPPTLVGILDRMERDGWICRVSHPSDRRKKLIQPTDEAKPVWSRIVACARRIRRRATRGLSGDERRTLHNLLYRIRDNLSESSRPRGAKTTKV